MIAWAACSELAVAHCNGCHTEWEAYDAGDIDHDHRLDYELKDGRWAYLCCEAHEEMEQEGMLK